MRLFQRYCVQLGDPVQENFWKLEFGGPEEDREGVDAIKGGLLLSSPA